VLGRVITEATARADARIEGPWWRVLPENPARLEACRQAANDARAKAGAFAEALGGELGPIAWVRESRDEGLRAQPGRFVALSAGGEQPEMTVEPGEMDVTAAVDVSFELRDPGQS
jgi:uncharacterized protein YggE